MGKNEGKKFEEDFEKSCPGGWQIIRLKDSSASWSHDKSVSRFTPKNMCDFIMFTGRTLYAFELKSFLGKSISYKLLNDEKEQKLVKMVMFHQDVPENSEAYYVLNFRDLNETYAIKAPVVRMLKHSMERKSISLDQTREHGILIKHELKRVRYRYDLSVFI